MTWAPWLKFGVRSERDSHLNKTFTLFCDFCLETWGEIVSNTITHCKWQIINEKSEKVHRSCEQTHVLGLHQVVLSLNPAMSPCPIDCHLTNGCPSPRPGIGNVTGYPGVFPGNPHLYLSKPIPASTGAGFDKYGCGFCKNPRVYNPSTGAPSNTDRENIS